MNQKLHDELSAATRALRKVQDERDDAIYTARDRIHAEYAGQMKSARDAVAAAKSAFDAAEVAASSAHPMIGRKVHLPAVAGDWRRASQREKFGVIEVWVAGAPSNRSYTPEPGDVVIRVLKKDGSPSKEFRTTNDHFLNRLADNGVVEMGWKLLPEDGDAKP